MFHTGPAQHLKIQTVKVGSTFLMATTGGRLLIVLLLLSHSWCITVLSHSAVWRALAPPVPTRVWRSALLWHKQPCVITFQVNSISIKLAKDRSTKVTSLVQSHLPHHPTSVTNRQTQTCLKSYCIDSCFKTDCGFCFATIWICCKPIVNLTGL